MKLRRRRTVRAVIHCQTLSELSELSYTVGTFPVPPLTTLCPLVNVVPNTSNVVHEQFLWQHCFILVFITYNFCILFHFSVSSTKNSFSFCCVVVFVSVIYYIK